MAKLANNIGKQKEKEQSILNYLKNNIRNTVFNNANYATISSLITSAKINNCGTKFPDFLCDNGLIEHFEITSKVEDKKHGSEVKNIEPKIEEDVNKIRKDFFSKVENIPQNKNILVNNSIDYCIEGASLALLRKSFIKNFDKHINSLEKYEYKDKINCFLIELNGPLICKLVDNGLRCIFYQLNKDKYLMEYALKYKKILKYIFYIQSNFIEIIDLDKINENEFIDYDDTWVSGRLRHEYIQLKLFLTKY